MAEEKIYYPETIQDASFPLASGVDLNVSQTTSNDTYSSEKIKEQGFPVKKIATELLGVALNTKSKKILAEFEFTESGALQIGKYTPGLYGDLRISPKGITARDLSGITTFAIEGATGSAVFKGIVQAGSIVSDSYIVGESVLTGYIDVGNGNVKIDGENKRIIINDGSDDRILIGYQSGGF